MDFQNNMINLPNTNDTWSIVNNKNVRKHNKSIPPETHNPVRICKWYVKGTCRNTRGCTFGLHISEQERNTNQFVSICFSFDNSPYTHSIEQCVKNNNGLCELCAFGNCSDKDKCIYRHDPNSRYKKDCDAKKYNYNNNSEQRNMQKELSYMYTICTNWTNGIWCNGFCNSQHPKQCPKEYALSKEFKTCPPECTKGFHQGSKNIVSIEKKHTPPICVEPEEECPIYKWGSKPPPPIFIKKVKKVDTETKYYYDEFGYECIDLFSTQTTEIVSTQTKPSNVLPKSTVSTNITVKNKKCNKEVLSPEEFYENDPNLYIYEQSGSMSLTNNTESSVDKTEEFENDPNLYIYEQSVSMSLTNNTDSKLKINIESVTNVSTNLTPKKKLSIIDRKKMKKIEKVKEKETKRQLFKIKNKKKNTDDNSDSDNSDNSDSDSDNSDNSDNDNSDNSDSDNSDNSDSDSDNDSDNSD